MYYFPTNIASMHLVMGCPNTSAGIKIVEKEPLEQPRGTQISTPSLITTSGVAIAVALVVPILVGLLRDIAAACAGCFHDSSDLLLVREKVPLFISPPPSFPERKVWEHPLSNVEHSQVRECLTYLSHCQKKGASLNGVVVLTTM